MHGSDHRGEGGFLPPPTRPRAVTGGIRLARRAASERSLWAQRWLAMFEAIGAGDRLRRGLEYARGGQVRSLEYEPGAAVAQVQGTRRTPYEARIALRAIPQEAWLAVADALAATGARRAALHRGELPDDVEAVLARLGHRLFPSDEEDVTATCTCDDWAVPCRHVAAACYLVGEAIDRDPLLVLELRGIDRRVLLALVDGRAVGSGDGAGDDEPAAVDAASDPAPEDPEGATDPWAIPAGAPAAPSVDLQPPSIDAPSIRVLGAPPQWRGEHDAERVLTDVVARAARSDLALDLALGRPGARRDV